MKASILTVTCLLSIFAFAEAEVRTFKDTTGREISATLIAVRGDQVEMNVGGKSYTLPISKFSEEDVAFIKEWGEANPAPIVVRGLYVEFDKKMDRLEGSKPDPDSKKGGSEISRTSFEYDINVRNSSADDLDDLKIAYTVYKTYRSRDASGASSDGMEISEGEETITTLAKNSDHTFTTDAVVATDTETKGKKDENGSSRKETILGVVARVFVGDTEVRVASYPDGLDQRMAALEEKEKKEEE